MGSGQNYEQITAELGKRWEVLKNIHKPYPCGIVINPVIDGCLDLNKRLSFPVEKIVSITLGGHPLLLERADRPNIKTGRESQVSAQHAAAVSLIFGKAGLPEFTDKAVCHPQVVNLRKKVKINVLPNTPVPNIEIDVLYEDGSYEKINVVDARGTDKRPLTDQEIETKFKELTSPYAMDCPRVENLIKAVWSIEDIEDFGRQATEY